MTFKQLHIRGISHSQSTIGAYALLLEEESSGIKLPIVIGEREAQAITIGLSRDFEFSGKQRPLTHDVFHQFISQAGYEIVSVVIYDLVEGVFYSNINFTNKSNGSSMVIDTRTSDAVAMAVRAYAPIFTTEEVLNEAGILLDIDSISTEEEYDEDDELKGETLDLKSLSTISSEELKVYLEKAVQAEDFDTAAVIQDILNKRAKKID